MFVLAGVNDGVHAITNHNIPFHTAWRWDNHTSRISLLFYSGGALLLCLWASDKDANGSRWRLYRWNWWRSLWVICAAHREETWLAASSANSNEEIRQKSGEIGEGLLPYNGVSKGSLLLCNFTLEEVFQGACVKVVNVNTVLHTPSERSLQQHDVAVNNQICSERMDVMNDGQSD